MQDIALLSFIKPWHDDVASPHEAKFFARIAAAYAFQHLGHPRSRRIDECARRYRGFRRMTHVEKRHAP